MTDAPLARWLAAVCLLAAGAILMLGGVLAHGRDDPSRPVVDHVANVGKMIGDDPVAIARRYIGRNPTGRRSLWCADFVGLVEREAGRAGTGSRLARSYLGYGRTVPLAQARPGNVVVLSRGRRGGHVGYLVSRDGDRVRLISGNSCRPRQVCEAEFPAGRVIGIRRP